MLSNLVNVIDDDDSLRSAIVSTLEDAGYNVQSWANGQVILENPALLNHSVVVLDLLMPNLNGLALISHINHFDLNTQFVFISGAAAPSEIISAFHQGACDFILKPFETETLIAAVDKALKVIDQRLHQSKDAATLMDKFNTLTVKEKLVFENIGEGLKIKQIATQLNLAEITVKVYKAKIMHKLDLKSLTELAKFSQALSLQLPANSSYSSKPKDE